MWKDVKLMLMCDDKNLVNMVVARIFSVGGGGGKSSEVLREH